jgi:hypothetical protein
MDARAVERVALELKRKSRWTRAHTALAGVLAVAALISIALAARPVEAALLSTVALLEGGAAGLGLVSRRARIEQLALEPAAYFIPEVREFANALTGPDGRLALARHMEAAVEAARHGDSTTVYLRDRVLASANELSLIAAELRSPKTAVDPSTAVECRRLVANAVASPLCNPELDARDLAARLFRIRAGICAADRAGG